MHRYIYISPAPFFCCTMYSLLPLQQTHNQKQSHCTLTSLLLYTCTTDVRNHLIQLHATVGAKVAETKFQTHQCERSHKKFMQKKSHIAYNHFHAIGCTSGRAALSFILAPILLVHTFPWVQFFFYWSKYPLNLKSFDFTIFQTWLGMDEHFKYTFLIKFSLGVEMGFCSMYTKTPNAQNQIWYCFWKNWIWMENRGYLKSTMSEGLLY
jgi:hypothetical protein